MCQVYFHKGIILRWPQLSISVASWGKRGYSRRPQDQAVFHRSRRDSDKGSLQGSQTFGAGSSFVWKGGIYFYHLLPPTWKTAQRDQWRSLRELQGKLVYTHFPFFFLCRYSKSRYTPPPCSRISHPHHCEEKDPLDSLFSPDNWSFRLRWDRKPLRRPYHWWKMDKWVLFRHDCSALVLVDVLQDHVVLVLVLKEKICRYILRKQRNTHADTGRESRRRWEEYHTSFLTTLSSHKCTGCR